jgi:hypothetical protein
MLVAWAAIGAPAAFAGDRPATPEGANDLIAFFSRFLPAPSGGGADLVTVKPDGADYRVSVDVAAFNGLIKQAGASVSYEPATLVYKLVEQDDGKWRLILDSLPKLVSHAGDQTASVDLVNPQQTIVIDPALAWWLSGSAGVDRGVVRVTAPNLDQTIDFGAVKADYTTAPGQNGVVSTAIKEEIVDVGFKVATTGKDGAPANVSGRLGKAVVNLGADGLKSRKLFDLLSLLSAHRDDLAAHEAELKDLLRPLAEPGLKIAEGGEGTSAIFASPYGAVALSSLKAAAALSNEGPQSALDVTASAEGLSLPVGLVPPEAADLTPSKVDLTVALKGFDIAAAANEAITVMHLGGPGPVIADADSAKISTALVGSGPIRLEIAPSHIVAPAIDADFQGVIRYAREKPSGEMTIRMRNFDTTMAALKGLGPDLAAKTIPAIAMAKGLAKTESDGSLSWLIEIGEDRSMKINGIPLGKAP